MLPSSWYKQCPTALGCISEGSHLGVKQISPALLFVCVCISKLMLSGREGIPHLHMGSALFLVRPTTNFRIHYPKRLRCGGVMKDGCRNGVSDFMGSVTWAHNIRRGDPVNLIG